MPKILPTVEDGAFEKYVTLQVTSLLNALPKQERDTDAERRLVECLFTGDDWALGRAWDSFRRGCAFNHRPIDATERIVRITVRLYGLSFSDSPNSFREVGIW